LLERLTRTFRLLLSAFDGGMCPLCAVCATLKASEVERVRSESEHGTALCGKHLEACFATSDDRAARARLTRKTVEATIAGGPGCRVCERLSIVEERLARSIRRLDRRMRFRKALETAPLFCRRHANLIVSDPIAVNFAQVQGAKLQHLRDDLAQAELLNRDSLEPLTAAALTYLGSPVLEHLPLHIQDSPEASAAEGSEFEKWDDELRLQHLGKLESEAASLRYRNAMLAEENRRLKAARVAGEAIRRDLERDRSQLLAAAGEPPANSLKSPNRR
jgi:hypothetical protein